MSGGFFDAPTSEQLDLLDELPGYALVFRALLGDFYDDVPGRVSRLRLLLALDSDFGGGGIMIPGGSATHLAYLEARSSFVMGNFVGTVLLAQALMENLLAAHLHLLGISEAIHNQRPEETFPERIQLKDTIARCRAEGLIAESEEQDLWRLAKLRNPLSHYRDLNDPDRLERRALDHRIHPYSMAESDARFAITTIIRMMAKEEFAIGRWKEGKAR